MSLLKKIADSISYSFDIPEEEKKIAMEARDLCDKAIASIDSATSLLDKIYDPFKNFSGQVPVKYLQKKRGILNRYKQHIKEKFNDVKKTTILCISKLKIFSSDSELEEILDSISSAMEGVESAIEEALEILSNYTNEQFVKDLIEKFNEVYSACEQLETVINDRAIDYINTEILTVDWLQKNTKELNIDIKQRIPQLLQLVKEQNNTGTSQALNPLDAQRMANPNSSTISNLESLMNFTNPEEPKK